MFQTLGFRHEGRGPVGLNVQGLGLLGGLKLMAPAAAAAAAAGDGDGDSDGDGDDNAQRKTSGYCNSDCARNMKGSW